MRSWAPAPHGALPSEIGAGRTCPPPQEGSCSEGLGSRGQKPRCGCAGQAFGREPGATHAWDSALQQGPSPGDSPCCKQGLGWWPGAPSGCSWRPLSHRASAAHPALPSPLGTQRRAGGGSGAGRCGGDSLSRGQVRGQQHYQDSPAAHLWGKAWWEPHPTPHGPHKSAQGAEAQLGP